MSCNSLTKIIPPIRSRCLSIRVACPSNQELKQTLNTIANQEMIKLSEQQMDLIVKQSENNVRKAINTMQLTTLETFSKNVYVPDYLLSIKSICNDVIGDICGIVSGSLATVFTLGIVDKFGISNTISPVF